MRYAPFFCLVLTGVSACFAVASATEPPVPEGVAIVRDIAYLGPHRQQTLDLYLPTRRPNGERSPEVVMIHGGGWVGGDKAEARSFNICTTLAASGYVCASINYLLSPPEKRWPQQVYDCKNAVRFMRVNADKYGIDADHIGVIGGSAGGHLALMVAYTNRVPRLEPATPYPLVSDRVQCVVDMYGITDLLTRQKTDDTGKPTGQTFKTQALLTKTRDEDPALWKLASPVYHVSRNSPPTLILHGKADTTVDYEQARELAKVLKENSVDHQIVLLEGVGHTFDLDSWKKKPLPEDVRSIVLKFFDRHLKKH